MSGERYNDKSLFIPPLSLPPSIGIGEAKQRLLYLPPNHSSCEAWYFSAIAFGKRRSHLLFQISLLYIYNNVPVLPIEIYKCLVQIGFLNRNQKLEQKPEKVKSFLLYRPCR